MIHARRLSRRLSLSVSRQCARWLPDRHALLNSRWLRPVAHRLDDDRLWHADRASVARAVAIGLFFGTLLPVAQIVAAVVAAVFLRAHIAIAAGFTLVTNPLTFAPIYWLAHRLGAWLLDARADDETARALEAQAQAVPAATGWLDGLWSMVHNAGAPLALGLLVLAVGGALLGFALSWALWRPRRKAARAG